MTLYITVWVLLLLVAIMWPGVGALLLVLSILGAVYLTALTTQERK